MDVAPLARMRLDEVTAELWRRAPYEIEDRDGAGVVGFAFEGQEGVDAIASDRVRTFRRRANTLAWIPPGCSVYSASRTGGEYLVLRGIASDAVGEPATGGRAVNDIVDRDAVATAQAFRRLLLSSLHDHETARAGLDTLTATVLGRLRQGPDRSSTWLTAARLAAVDRTIEARMGERLGVSDLADALGLSTGFLALAFRAALGTSPHRYLMERRLSRARSLLDAGNASISVVALDCGFADQAHLTRCMRAALGVTPGRYRRRGRVE